ncbi:hypothetical protein METHB2_250001 [Candidatus Methylobacter favarea]|uniref:Uncharacterized protein n=1 Tax=Candidatus Methylobacter favarea TaxID=2707345 RepID=A0A8S0XFQ9_9GAMM|nr:hypothetical protein METHB2_250001 [Candidatus Methylobacter favarea]
MQLCLINEESSLFEDILRMSAYPSILGSFVAWGERLLGFGWRRSENKIFACLE